MIETLKHELLFLTALVVLASSCPFAAARTQAPADSDGPLWNVDVINSDCSIEERSWDQESVQPGSTAARYDQFTFTAGSGSRLLVHRSTTSAFVIPELTAFVRVKSSREGVRLSARVILPHSLKPDGTPISVKLEGPVSRRRDQWEKLEFSGDHSLRSLLHARRTFLQSKYQREISLRDAYLDQLSVNIYTGRGKTQVNVEDFLLDGVVEAKRVSRQFDKLFKAQSIASGFDGRTRIAQVSKRDSESLVKRDGTVLLVEQKPFFPRIVEHNGESFEYLKAIGFNTIELKSNATADQLKEARKVGIWLIAPPPASVGVEPIGFEYDSVLAWSVGRSLTGRNESQIRQLIREIRETDRRTGRPIFGHSVSHWSTIARQLDIHSIGLQPIGTSYLLSQYSNWIEARAKSIGSSLPICADIQTEMSSAVLDQTTSIFGSKPPTPLEYQQIKSLAAEAVSAGSRCLRFRSRSRLDANDPETRLRSQTIEYVNRWLSQIEHWVSGGVVLGSRQQKSGNNILEITALSTNRARLLLVQRPTHHEQYWAGDCPVQSINVFDTDTIHTGRIYQLADSELAPLSTRRSAEGTAVTVENAPFMVSLVMTQDTKLINDLTSKINSAGQASMFETHLSITQQWLAIEQLLSDQLTQLSKSSAEGSGALNEAVTLLQNAKRLSQQKSYAQARPFLLRADERLAFFRRDMQAKALGMFQSKTSSALTMHAALVPLHWVLANQIPQIEKEINSLAAGDFEDLDLMKKSGWSNSRVEDHRLRTHVELSNEAAKDGATGLKMSVSGALPLVENVPLWVSSPPIRIKPRQLVRVHGWVNIRQAIKGSETGLRIVDSVAGTSLSNNLIKTEGWQQFTLYRTAAEDTQFRLKFELTGIGEVMIDEVTVQVLNLPAPSRSAKK